MTATASATEATSARSARAEARDPALSLLVPEGDVEDPEISIVVPALNEQLTIADFVEWAREGLKKAGASVVQFVRYAVGDGIEKKQDDFVSEVMAQVKAQDKSK